jgi:hypothetical protein
MTRNTTIVVIAALTLMVAASAIFMIKRPAKETWEYDEQLLSEIERAFAGVFGGVPKQPVTRAQASQPAKEKVHDEDMKRRGPLTPDPSVYKWFPLHSSQHDPFRSLRLNGGGCFEKGAKGLTRNPLCSQSYHKLECGGTKQVGNNKAVECVWRAPVTVPDWLNNQKCVTYVPPRIDIDTDYGAPRDATENQFNQTDLKPQICADALKNPKNRFNVIALFKLKLDDRGRGLGKDRVQITNTKTDGDGYGMQMSIEINNGTLTDYTVDEMGFGYKVGDIIIIDQINIEKSPRWTVVDREIFPAVLDYDDDVAYRNFQVSDQDTYPAEVVQYLFNPRGLTDDQLLKAWTNSCKAVCTNSEEFGHSKKSPCFDTCMHNAPDEVLKG